MYLHPQRTLSMPVHTLSMVVALCLQRWHSTTLTLLLNNTGCHMSAIVSYRALSGAIFGQVRNASASLPGPIPPASDSSFIHAYEAAKNKFEPVIGGHGPYAHNQGQWGMQLALRLIQ